MTKQTPEAQPKLYNFAEWVLEDEQRRNWYDDAKMHWIGDPDPAERENGRHPWVKRVKHSHEYTYSQPVLAAFSIARSSLISVRKDPWHSDQNPDAWFVGVHDLSTGLTREHDLIESRVSAQGHMRLRMNGSPYQPPRDQKRLEARLQPGHYSAEAVYRNGLREQPVQYEDIISLEAMMRVVNEANGLLLPQRLAAERERQAYYALTT